MGFTTSAGRQKYFGCDKMMTKTVPFSRSGLFSDIMLGAWKTNRRANNGEISTSNRNSRAFIVKVSDTNNNGLWALIAGHVDGASGGAEGGDQRRLQQIQLDRDVMGRGTIVVAHLDLDGSGRVSLRDFIHHSFFTGSE